MCAAFGGFSKVYGLRRPFDENDVVGRPRESFISNYFFLSSVDDAFMRYPFGAVPYLHFCGYLFDWDLASIRQYQGAFGDASQLGDLPLFPHVAVDAVLLDRHAEHLRRRRTIDVSAVLKNVETPLFPGEPCDNSRLNGREV